MCVLCHGLRRFGRAKLVAMGGVCTVLYALGAFRRLFGAYTQVTARPRPLGPGRKATFISPDVKIRSHLPTTGRANRTQQRIQKQVTDKTQLFLHRLLVGTTKTPYFSRLCVSSDARGYFGLACSAVCRAWVVWVDPATRRCRKS
jgi:hypothetical protein